MLSSSAISHKYVEKLEDQIYIMCMLSKLLDLNFHVTAILLQHLLEVF